LTSIHKLRSVLGLKGRLSLSRGFVRRHLWFGPVVALVALVFAGTWVRSRMEGAIQLQTESQLRALLDADVTALELWLRSQEANTITAAQAPRVRQTVLDLVRLAQAGEATGATLLQAPEAGELKSALKPWLDAHHYAGYVVLDRQTRIVASKSDNLVGQESLAGYGDFVEAVLSGRALVSRPFPSIAPVIDEWGRLSVGVPTMFAAAPVRNDDGAAVAVLALRILPDQEFTRILNVARPGQSGETYAFDRQGVLLSRSRFEDQLKQIGLLPDKPDSRSVLALEIRDPLVDLTTGATPALRRSELPLTRPVKDAVAGHSGVDVQGYRDYRGVVSIAAWKWLPDYGFGVVTEIDKSEMFGPVAILRTAFWTLFGLLLAAALSLLGLTLLAGRLERRVREAVIAAGRLGQYALEEKIGEGGMGSVYRGRHAMLRRPTAIKLLEPSKTTDVAIERFEREVQLTSQLNHPNTITIYDYGRTEEGVFYYAMEYLDGLSLQLLVDCFGPQPDGRVIQILLQVCGSLTEAHTVGLIHRDIKPANIMLTRRGGVRDYVKLLDFGLVKAVDSQKMRALTAADSITGTPLYMSPESIEDANRSDCRSDLYSLGAVGYFLLTGHAVFDATSVLEIIRHHLSSTPVSPSERAGRPVARDLEQLIMACLAKSPEQRPQTAAKLAEALGRCVPLTPWTPADAERWWQAYESPREEDATGAVTKQIDLSATAEHPGLHREP
jgi:hypothetical protein